MTPKYRALLLLAIIFLLIKSFQYLRQPDEPYYENEEAEESSERKLKVSVYYEALCSDSRFFIVHQLLPAFDKLERYIELDLVPYGKAKTIEENGIIEFECQHDVIECEANKIHACGISLEPDTKVQLNYVSCMIQDNMQPKTIGEECAKKLNLNFEPILECARGDKGSLLLKKYGEQTNALSPSVKFIPTIEINGSQNYVSQAALLKDFKSAICDVLREVRRKPAVC